MYYPYVRGEQYSVRGRYIQDLQALIEACGGSGGWRDWELLVPIAMAAPGACAGWQIHGELLDPLYNHVSSSHQRNE